MNITSLIKPKAIGSAASPADGRRMMIAEGAASLGIFSVTTSGLLVAFALALGATNLQIGIMAAIPFLTQLLQLPAILLVEGLRRRKAITLASWIPAQSIWIAVAAIPWLVDSPGQTAVMLLLGLLALRGIAAAITNCSWNSWIKDLIPSGELGQFFSQRLLWGTVVAISYGVAGAFFVDWWMARAAPGQEILGYVYVLLAGALLLGVTSPLFLLLVPEPSMPVKTEPLESLGRLLAVPFRDRNFRRLTNFLLLWSFAINLAVPFFTVFMLDRLGFSLLAIIGLNILSQLAMILFLRVWGVFADRFGSKVVLSMSASLYLLAIMGWTFTTSPDAHTLTVPLVVMLQIFAGIAAAGVNLASGTIGLKLAPTGQATSFMVMATTATQLGTGLGPLAGGLLADYFGGRRFTIGMEWADPTGVIQVPAITLTGFDFLFAIAVVMGVMTLRFLAQIREEGEVGKEVVMQELLQPTRDMARTVGAIPGMRFVGGFPYAYLRRIPGVDVALGVTAYQLGYSVKAALTAAHHTAAVEKQVAWAVKKFVHDAGEKSENRFKLARQAARGAVHAVDDVAWDIGMLARGAVQGTFASLGKHYPEDSWRVLREASYGSVEGAKEMGADVVLAATQAVAGARQAAINAGLPEEEAINHAVSGVIAAASDIGPETAARVKASLPEYPLE